jgi:hypothetical protein
MTKVECEKAYEEIDEKNRAIFNKYEGDKGSHDKRHRSKTQKEFEECEEITCKRRSERRNKEWEALEKTLEEIDKKCKEGAGMNDLFPREDDENNAPPRPTHNIMYANFYGDLTSLFLSGDIIEKDEMNHFTVGARSVVYIATTSTQFCVACYEGDQHIHSLPNMLVDAARIHAVREASLFLTDLLALQERHGAIVRTHIEADPNEPSMPMDVVEFDSGHTGTRRLDEDAFQIP